jgi:hypothetical protein
MVRVIAGLAAALRGVGRRSYTDSETFVRGMDSVILSAAKDLGTEKAVSLVRRPDPSLRYAPFRMTSGAHELIRIRIMHAGLRSTSK